MKLPKDLQKKKEPEFGEMELKIIEGLLKGVASGIGDFVNNEGKIVVDKETKALREKAREILARKGKICPFFDNGICIAPPPIFRESCNKKQFDYLRCSIYQEYIDQYKQEEAEH